ncbi:MAG: hypothetical protein AAF296_14075 [Pseudomonadota bacterium]
MIGAVVMFGGFALLFGVEKHGPNDNWLVGIALFITAGTMWGGYTVLLRQRFQRESVVAVSA